jgi:two-component system, OmpR family, osmolarity sensor histidine kinase EnvZ
MTTLVEAAATAWPLAATVACAVTVDRLRASRRRESLNRTLHELRRPLQVMALDRASINGSGRPGGGGHLDAALAALADLDAEINGEQPNRLRAALDAREVITEAVGRWHSPAAMLGRELELQLPFGAPRIRTRREAIAAALDNLISNSLEHGGTRIRVTARSLHGRLRISVADSTPGGRMASLAGPLRRQPSGSADPRRGHGLEIVSRFAAEHGGRFAFHRGDAGSISLLELPLADA